MRPGSPYCIQADSVAAANPQAQTILRRAKEKLIEIEDVCRRAQSTEVQESLVLKNETTSHRQAGSDARRIKGHQTQHQYLFLCEREVSSSWLIAVSMPW
jgi:hypothetical protein